MKIEKLNDRQIRCTLTREDLEERQIKLSELAYGSEKTRSLFHDMMQQAEDDFGFEASDMPLMIEAIPLPSESIVLIISKVDSPEEIDTRFSSFTADSSAALDAAIEEEESDDTDELDAWLKKLEHLPNEKETAAPEDNSEAPVSDDDAALSAMNEDDTHGKVRLFTFEHLDTAFRIAKNLDCFYHADNSIYKDEGKKIYYLLMRQGNHTIDEFNRIGNKVSEYVKPAHYTDGTEAYLNEHLTVIIREYALQTLSNI